VSKAPSVAGWASELDQYSSLLRKEVQAGPVFGVKQLAVNGADVMRECGMRPGPGVGMQLDMLLAAVVADEVSRSREDQLAWLRAGSR
jgi:tRNA nucleotidyltransferase (CCA-adding enzyme)